MNEIIFNRVITPERDFEDELSELQKQLAAKDVEIAALRDRVEVLDESTIAMAECIAQKKARLTQEIAALREAIERLKWKIREEMPDSEYNLTRLRNSTLEEILALLDKWNASAEPPQIDGRPTCGVCNTQHSDCYGKLMAENATFRERQPLTKTDVLECLYAVLWDTRKDPGKSHLSFARYSAETTAKTMPLPEALKD